MGDWVAFESKDEGATWTQTDDPTVPYNWPGNQPREKMERMELVQPGRYLPVRRLGGLGVLARGAEGEAEALGSRYGSIHLAPA